MGLKKGRVVITQKARLSIREIYDYVKSRSSKDMAKHVKDSIIEKCESLQSFSAYSKAPYLAEYPEGFLSVNIWEYLIIYIVKKDEVRVLNVIHGKIDPAKRRNRV